MVEVKRELRSPREISKMRAAGLVVWEAHQAAHRLIKPGITTQTLEDAVRETFERHNAEPLFLNYGGIKGVRPPFPAVTCISINEELVHGIPGGRILVNGDIVSLDTGCRLGGWCGDAAITHQIGTIDNTKTKLLQVTLGTLNLAFELMSQFTIWSKIAKELEAFVKDAGFTVIEDMVGHGIGKNLHEPPQVPNYFNRDIAQHEDFDIKPGVVLAIEPMVSVGTMNLTTGKDGWTLSTADKKPCAHFEHTIAMTKDGPIRLTGAPDEVELKGMAAWLQNPDEWVRW